MYIYQQNGWPHFTWSTQHINNLLIDIRYLQGKLLGRMDSLGFQLQKEASLQTLTQEVLKTSEIEGEKLDTEQVRSSIAKRLGIEVNIKKQVDRDVEGIVEVMIDATYNYHKSLTKERLFHWHTALFPSEYSGFQKINVGKWRTKQSGPMQVISGPHGRERIHYEAPAYSVLKKEMSDFLKWINTPTEIDLVLQSALAHFWFVTIHPFDDGNGRIARAIADMLLARSEGNPQRFYSMSAQIQRERNDYYNILESCQKGTLDITAWIEWYLNCLQRAMTLSENTLKNILTKARFWQKFSGENLNERQKKMINRLLDGFFGKLTSSKWAKITKCSQDTALRDITDLIKRKILIKEEAGGRSTSYHLTSI